MNIIFIHQTIPGQFKHLAPFIARNENNRVIFITEKRPAGIKRVEKIEYVPERCSDQRTHKHLIGLTNNVFRGQAVANAAFKLRKSGFIPDLVYAHPGWGESLFIKDIYPDVPLLNYFEFFYHPFGADTFFDPNEEVTSREVYRIRTKNATNLLSLDACDWGISPTYWQWKQQPPVYRNKISVIHDGIDTSVVHPDPEARFTLPDGRQLSRQDEVLTYVARDLEPYRGLPSFLHAAERVLAKRPNCQIVIVGREGVSYGRRPKGYKSFKEQFLAEVDLDQSRVHFVGLLPYRKFLSVLQISSAHVYLTVPFVLSWSFLEAMACGCVMIGSDTPPVAEVIEHGHNGFLVDFFSPDDIAAQIIEVLEMRDKMGAIRDQARKTVKDNYELANCMRKQLRLIQELANCRDPMTGGRLDPTKGRRSPLIRRKRLEAVEN